jgi:polysaccharide biosynthesis/export protein
MLWTVKKLRHFLLFCLMAILFYGCYPYPLLEDVKQDPDYTYQIGPGDSLTIFVWGNPELSETAIVRPDGKVTFPLVEELLAMGKTPAELARDIEKILSVYLKNPQVVVMPHGFKGVKSQQIRVIGRIGSGGSSGGSSRGGAGGGGSGSVSGSGGGGGQGGSGGGIGRYQGKTIPYERGLTLLDVIIQVGLNQYADGNRSTVVRYINGEQRTFSVRIDDLIDNADLSANVLMMPGDILIIPDALF